jgi:predicted transcriptional regulator
MSTSAPTDTTAFRLQLMGVLSGILKQQSEGGVVTNRSVAREIGANEQTVGRFVNELVSRGIIRKEQTTNRQGRGRAFSLQLVETAEYRTAVGLSQ